MADTSLSVGRSAGWMVGGRGLQIAVSLGANLALVRFLTPADFGRYALLAANVGIVSTLVNLRLEDVLLRAPDDEVGRDRIGIYGTGLAIQVGAILVGSAAVLAVLDLLDAYAALLILSSGLGSWVSAQSALYERESAYRNLSVLETGGQITAQVATVGGAAAGLGAVVLYLRDLVRLAVVGGGLGALGKLRRLYPRIPRAREVRHLWIRVRGFWGDGVLEQSFDRLVLAATGFLVGDHGTGLFYQARLLARAPQRLLAPLAFRIRMNQFAHHTFEEARSSTLIRALAVTAAPLIGGAALAVWFADPVIPWLLGEGWSGVVPLFIAMLGLIPGLTLLDTLKAYFMAEDKMAPFLWLGRGVQYFGAAVVAGASLWMGANPARALAFGLSAAYLLPVLTLVLFLLWPWSRAESTASDAYMP